MKKLMGVGLAAGFAVAALASAASANQVLILRDPSGIIPAGTHLTATSHNLVTVTSAGNIECETDELEQIVLTNSAVNDKGTTQAGMSRNFGNFGKYIGTPAACYTSAVGPAIITTSNYPWREEFTSKGYVTKGTKRVVFTSEFLALQPPNKCTFEDAKILSTYVPGPKGSPLPLKLVTAGAKFKLNKSIPGTALACPKEGTLGGTWTVEDASGIVESELFP